MSDLAENLLARLHNLYNRILLTPALPDSGVLKRLEGSKDFSLPQLVSELGALLAVHNLYPDKGCGNDLPFEAGELKVDSQEHFKLAVHAMLAGWAAMAGDNQEVAACRLGKMVKKYGAEKADKLLAILHVAITPVGEEVPEVPHATRKTAKYIAAFSASAATQTSLRNEVANSDDVFAGLSALVGNLKVNPGSYVKNTCMNAPCASTSRGCALNADGLCFEASPASASATRIEEKRRQLEEMRRTQAEAKDAQLTGVCQREAPAIDPGFTGCSELRKKVPELDKYDKKAIEAVSDGTICSNVVNEASKEMNAYQLCIRDLEDADNDEEMARYSIMVRRDWLKGLRNDIRAKQVRFVAGKVPAIKDAIAALGKDAKLADKRDIILNFTFPSVAGHDGTSHTTILAAMVHLVNRVGTENEINANKGKIRAFTAIGDSFTPFFRLLGEYGVTEAARAVGDGARYLGKGAGYVGQGARYVGGKVATGASKAWGAVKGLVPFAGGVWDPVNQQRYVRTSATDPHALQAVAGGAQPGDEIMGALAHAPDPAVAQGLLRAGGTQDEMVARVSRSVLWPSQYLTEEGPLLTEAQRAMLRTLGAGRRGGQADAALAPELREALLAIGRY